MAYGVRGIPAAYVVGRDGKLAWYGHPADEAFEATIRQLLERSAEERHPSGSSSGLAGVIPGPRRAFLSRPGPAPSDRLHLARRLAVRGASR